MNPFVIGIPGFLISCIVAYVCGEVALKYLNAEQAGEVVLRIRRHRIRYVWTAAGLFLVFFGASLICGGLSLAFLFGACAATSFVPKKWLESSKPGSTLDSKHGD